MSTGTSDRIGRFLVHRSTGNGVFIADKFLTGLLQIPFDDWLEIKDVFVDPRIFTVFIVHRLIIVDDVFFWHLFRHMDPNRVGRPTAQLLDHPLNIFEGFFRMAFC